MTMYAPFAYPRMKDPKAFEALCCDILNKKYKEDDYGFSLYGRNGQKQYGIDIECQRPQKDGGFIAVQCKNHIVPFRLDKKFFGQFKKNIISDVTAAERLPYKISRMIIMTALERDKNVQNFIRELNEQFTGMNIEIMFWDDIEAFLYHDKEMESIYYQRYNTNTVAPVYSAKKSQNDENGIFSSAYQVGDYVNFGRYPDSDKPIEWEIIAKKEESCLLISRYGIGKRPFHEAAKEITWENCSIRKWLNTSFLQEAFSVEERRYIQPVSNLNPGNGKNGIPVQTTTFEQIFLLSYDEANTYFHSDSSRILRDSENIARFWALRTNGSDLKRVQGIHPDGSFRRKGYVVQNKDMTIRPACWIQPVYNI